MNSTMQFDIDDIQIERGTKVVVGLAAVWAIIWKIFAPLCRWVRNWLAIPGRIESLAVVINTQLKPNGLPICEKIADIKAHVLVLTAREQLRFENSPIPGYECDPAGACVAVNPAWCKLFGVTETHMLGNGWLDVIADPEERERVMDNWQHSVKNRYPHREKYRARNLQTGEELWCESATVECIDKLHNTLLYCGTIAQKGPDWT